MGGGSSLALCRQVLWTYSMPITLNELTVNFAHLNRQRLLQDWRWLLGPVRQPILLTAPGDAFVQDVADGSILLLDTAAGELLRVADDLAGFRALLADREFMFNHFAVEMVADLREAGASWGEVKYIASDIRPCSEVNTPWRTSSLLTLKSTSL